MPTQLQLALLLVASPARAEPIVGRASVTDGDTIVTRDTKIRLHGIDAPESGQLCGDVAGKNYCCGQVAALERSSLIGELPPPCGHSDPCRGALTVEVCRKGTEGLNRWMVAQGHAIAYRRYSTDCVEA